MSLSRKAVERLLLLASWGAGLEGERKQEDEALVARARAALLPQEKRAGQGRGARAKGKHAEQEVVHLLRPVFPGCKRGFQSRGGGKEQADVIETGSFHVEVKRTEALSIYKAMEQAIADAPGEKVPLVLHRRNGRFWLAVLRADDLLALYAKAYPGPGREGDGWVTAESFVYDPTLDTEPREGQERES